MTPRDAICCGLTAITDDETTHEAAGTMLKQLMVRGFVVVSSKLVESVLEDAEEGMRREYLIDGKPHPAMVSRYERDLADILALRAELKGTNNE